MIIKPPISPNRLKIPVSLVVGAKSNRIIGKSTLEEICYQMTSPSNDKLIDLTQRLKKARKQDKKQYVQLKETECKGIVIGEYSKRSDLDCELYAPLIGFDVDAVKDEFDTSLILADCKNCPYIYLAYPSPSGHGLRIFIWCNATPDTHKAYYEKISNYLGEYLKLPLDKRIRKELKAKGLDNKAIQAELKKTAHIDTSTKNISRIWFYTHVAKSDLYINPNSTVFNIESQADDKDLLRPPTPIQSETNHIEQSEKIRLCELMVDERNTGVGRNDRLFFLACILHEHGLNQTEILNYCLRYEESDFDKSEITKTVNSAVKRATFSKFSDKQLLNWKSKKESTTTNGDIEILPVVQTSVKDADSILTDILNHLPTFSKSEFIEKAGLADSNESIKQKHYLVVIIDEILQVAEDKKFGLCKRHDFVYLFNGCYWQVLPKERLKTFLGEAAARLGFKKIDSKYFEFRDKLYKQFLSSGNFTNQKRNDKVTLINLQNGTFQISPQQSKLKDFDRDDFLTYQLPFNYNPTAKAPIFDKYLKQVLPDETTRKVLAEFIGYVFIRNLKLEKCLLLYGTGANGKSVFFEIVNALLGSQNISNLSLGNLTEENNRALIADKLLNYGSEIRGNIESDIFKQLVSGEPIQARLKYGNSFIMTNYAKLAFNCNTLPRDIEHNEAYFRRFLIVPFEVTIPVNDRNPELANWIIGKEMSGVFNWVLEGLKRILKNKRFTKSDAVQKAVQKYRMESDTVQLFLKDKNYVKHPTKTTLLKHLYFDYKNFCSDDGYKPLGKKNFSKRLEALELYPVRKKHGMTVPVEKGEVHF